ncbi:MULTISPECIES: carboxypeptidase regulatory-like domain-containing protein [Corallococcus]|uniref:carboxypeptidase regulatory-like domain-containing protein n=1 Tax=Corallococcus TaxID=83461 RepID=UPI00117D56F2|nr:MULTISPECIES: carboxypeptidase regulatory-like domain-containing protein [Corallococcus]NBD10825.1 carboxypeptidase regulatory-like domain-containing protein [Corallococcus silvisoli]TSC31731.1 carboxypeptidase regulatory-like domain-containing protein [Corallococcus sp. Z5C101001]
MRHERLLLLLSLLGASLCLGACGSLDNDPFRTGTVHGQLTEFDPAVALVSVVGTPGVRTGVDADGRFTLEDAPAGPAELFIVATHDKAARVPLTVQGGRSVEVAALTPAPAGTFFLKLHARGSLQIQGATASVAGTPIGASGLDDKAPQRMGPLPEGCYEVSVSARGFATASTQGCVSQGKQTVLHVELTPREAYAQQGCAVTGCGNGSHCASDGRCVECLDDTGCASPLVCRGARCEGPGPQCAPCTGNWQCGASLHCGDLPGGGTACVATCGTGLPDCAEGLTCQDGQCLPEPARFPTCEDFRQ